ncbi:ADP-ribosyltransferase domain-containing protein [Moraxella catarrhalis]|uniref:ADP-ribosyltransferase domain-containing protein n=1 Tax=Moraxella catarrhalis TaxID=480 RepID=UPI0007E3E0E4|nr:ADP-ribosyltransferase domain-containing protein [Moraxella catarrhalis]OAV29001.1 Phage protein [Moraxella catarrhalis]
MKNLINLERLKTQLANDFNVTIKDILAFLQRAVFNQELSDLSQKQVKVLIRRTDSKLATIFGAFAYNLKSSWQELFYHRYKVDAPKDIKALQKHADEIFKKPLQLDGKMGITLDELLDAFSQTERKKITSAIRLAHHDGLPSAKLVQMIRGSRARNYQDGILQTTTRHAKTIAHTGTAIVASQAKQAVIADNADIIKGIKVIATLDLRTSSICRGLDGVFMPLDKARYPPYHFNCRSSFEIVYDGYTAPKQRASMDGVVKNQTYYEWLKDQPARYQDEVLGKTRAKLFRDGGMSVERFGALQLDKHFTPLTLEQMRALEPRAFKKAFGEKILGIQNHPFYRRAKKKFDELKPIGEKFGLSDNELFSISAYTSAHGFVQSYFLKPTKFKNKDPKGYADIEEQINHMLKGLNKLPNYQGQVVRRVSLYDDLKNLKVGDVYQSPAFMSSAIIGESDVFSHYRVRMLIKVKTGKRIDMLAVKPEQREVLILPKTSFKIEKIQQKGDELWITMSEI